MTTLSQWLSSHHIKQATLAKDLGVSPATINLIVNHGKYPKQNADDLRQKLGNLLIQKGMTAKEITALLNPNPTGDATMLLRKQSLSPQAKKHFGLFANPFISELKNADELYQTADIRYVRSAMLDTAKHGGFIAVTGESGAGKTTLKRDLIDRLKRENQHVVVIEPYVLATEDNDIKGKTLKAVHLAEAILYALSPLETAKRSPEARFRQIHNALKESNKAGNKHVLIIEEAHSLPLPTLKHLKRFFELEDGYDKLLGIILIGQNELAIKLSEQNPAIREVVQRCEMVTLEPIAPNELASYLQHRLGKQTPLANVIDDGGINAIARKLARFDKKGKVSQSLLYPLAIGNLMTGAMNSAAELGVPTINADLVINL